MRDLSIAAAHVFTPALLALPWVLGFIGDHYGVVTALAVLLVQPVGIVVVAVVALRADKGEAPAEREPPGG